MKHHFSWTQFIPYVGHDKVHIATLLISSVLIILLGLVARISLGRGEVAVVPAGKVSIRGFFEMVCDLIGYLLEMVMGHEGIKYGPIFASIFVFILVNNLMGLLPGMTAATDNLNTTFALGIFSFVMYNAYGLKHHGFGYLKQFTGPVLLMAPFMFVIELFSHIVRPFTLGLRIVGNIQGDHAVLGAFLDIAPYGVPMIFYVMGIFVCVMQALVFTLLSMVYVSMATAHDH